MRWPNMTQFGILRSITAPLFSVFMAATTCFPAKAAVDVGTFGFVPIGDITYTGLDLEHATSVTLPANSVALPTASGFVNTVPQFYNGNPNYFYSGANSIPLLSLGNINIHQLNPPVLDLSAIGGSYSAVGLGDFLILTTPFDTYRFDLEELLRTSSDPLSLILYGTGTLFDANGSSVPGSISMAFTQTTLSSAVNASFTLATAAVPEPGTIGAGCCALGFLLLAGLRRAGRSAV